MTIWASLPGRPSAADRCVSDQVAEQELLDRYPDAKFQGLIAQPEQRRVSSGDRVAYSPLNLRKVFPFLPR